MSINTEEIVKSVDLTASYTSSFRRAVAQEQWVDAATWARTIADEWAKIADECELEAKTKP